MIQIHKYPQKAVWEDDLVNRKSVGRLALKKDYQIAQRLGWLDAKNRPELLLQFQVVEIELRIIH